MFFSVYFYYILISPSHFSIFMLIHFQTYGYHHLKVSSIITDALFVYVCCYIFVHLFI